jgi:hypothetical protein
VQFERQCNSWYSIDICSILCYNLEEGREAAMVKLVDTLVLGTNANASRFESEWRHFITIHMYCMYYYSITLQASLSKTIDKNKQKQ